MARARSAPTRAGPTRPLTRAERDELRQMLDAIPIGIDYRDERVADFVREWYRLHLDASAGEYAVHYLRAETATADVLERLRSALDEPDLEPSARIN